MRSIVSRWRGNGAPSNVCRGIADARSGGQTPDPYCSNRAPQISTAKRRLSTPASTYARPSGLWPTSHASTATRTIAGTPYSPGVADRPDIVLILTDQQRFDQIGYAS